MFFYMKDPFFTSTMKRTFYVVNIIFDVIRNGLHGYQYYCSHMT